MILPLANLNRRRIRIAVLGTLLTVCACIGCGVKPSTSGPEKPKLPATVKSLDGKLLLQLPEGWESSIGLNNAAQIEVVHQKRELYGIVISEAQEDFNENLQSYATFCSQRITEKLKDAKISEPKEIKVNNHPALQYEITGTHTASRVNVGYILTVEETETRYNQVLSWALRSKFNAHKEELATLANGLSEIPVKTNAQPTP